MKSYYYRDNCLSAVKLLSDRQIAYTVSRRRRRIAVDRHLADGIYAVAKSLYHKTIQGHYGCVNALEFSYGNEEFLASGSDDRRVLVWRSADLVLGSTSPKNFKMKSEHNSNIFCLAFTIDNGTLLSAGNDSQVIVHCLKTGQPKDVYILEDSVYALSCHPECPNIFSTASEDGKLTVFDLRAPKTADPCIMAKSHCSYQSVMFNPVESIFLLSTNEKEGINLWDTRRPRKCYKTVSILSKIGQSKPVAFFDDAGYFNACTLKSCTFGGPDDKYVMTGSDNFDCYVWPVPDLEKSSPGQPPQIVEQPLTLIGHRSIVNQVRYSHANHLLASSGVEKVIKLWSPFPLVDGRGAVILDTNDSKSPMTTAAQFSPKRQLYSETDFDRYVTLRGDLTPAFETAESSAANENHDPEITNMAEDPGMLAFFDSIVRLKPPKIDILKDCKTMDMEMTGVIGDRELSRFSLLDSDSEESNDDRNLIATGQYRNEVVSSVSSSSSVSSLGVPGGDDNPNLIAAIVGDRQSVVLSYGTTFQDAGQSPSTSSGGNAAESDVGRRWAKMRDEILRNGQQEELARNNEQQNSEEMTAATLFARFSNGKVSIVDCRSDPQNPLLKNNDFDIVLTAIVDISSSCSIPSLQIDSTRKWSVELLDQKSFSILDVLSEENLLVDLSKNILRLSAGKLDYGSLYKFSFTVTIPACGGEKWTNYTYVKTGKRAVIGILTLGIGGAVAPNALVIGSRNDLILVPALALKFKNTLISDNFGQLNNINGGQFIIHGSDLLVDQTYEFLIKIYNKEEIKNSSLIIKCQQTEISSTNVKRYDYQWQ
uniref:Uncharacterized protein n=1 Tax=Romanomermis culicivorax TaxID=13658 RepID=A0A915J844_ROMCU